MEREPNTIYVASLSYGKDSIAMLEAIKQLGYPLDRIVHAEVWATQDIPADLPPMMEFKAKADEKILQMYGIPVEHICAMKKPKPEDDALNSQSVNVERERGVSNPTKTSSTTFSRRETTSETSRDSRSQAERTDGANISSTTEKLTYEDIFYRTLHHHKKRKSHSQNVQVERERESGTTDSRSREREWDGVTNSRRHPSASRIYGFPINRGQWCNSNLKLPPLRISNLNQQRKLVYKSQAKPFPIPPLHKAGK